MWLYYAMDIEICEKIKNSQLLYTCSWNCDNYSQKILLPCHSQKNYSIKIIIGTTQHSFYIY